MGRIWIRKKKKKKGKEKNYCIKSFASTCYPAQLYSASGVDVDPHIRAATKEINRILQGVEKYAGRDRTLAFLAVSDGAEDDILRLDWIYHDEEIVSKDDGNY